MKIVCISDTHGMIKQAKFPAGDVLVLAGDILQNYVRGDPIMDSFCQEAGLRELDEFVATLDFKHVIFVAGNHDWLAERNKAALKTIKNMTYLCDSEVVIDGVKFYGSPWQPAFYNWAFNLLRKSDKLQRVWDAIPTDVDVLITHGPPYGILDKIDPKATRGREAAPLGCELLRERLNHIAPKLHVFGHIHGSYGQTKIGETIFVNAALCDENYKPVNQPQLIDLPNKGCRTPLECFQGNHKPGCPAR